MVLLLHVASLKKKKDVGASTGFRRVSEERGVLVDTALRPWSFAWKVLVGRVSPDARVTLSRKILGRFTRDCTIVP